jgi:uncharacterized protein YjcR
MISLSATRSIQDIEKKYQESLRMEKALYKKKEYSNKELIKELSNKLQVLLQPNSSKRTKKEYYSVKSKTLKNMPINAPHIGKNS